MVIDKQPNRGFKTAKEADKFAHERFPIKTDAIHFANHNGDGIFLTDKKFELFEMKDVKWNKFGG
jgi:hypothetical protein